MSGDIPTPKPWQSSEVALMTQLVEEAYASGRKPNWAFIAPQTGHTVESCKWKMSSIRAAAGAERSIRARMAGQPPSSVALPDATYAPRSITAWLCGDPPPGRSALDQRETEHRAPGITLASVPLELRS